MSLTALTWLVLYVGGLAATLSYPLLGLITYVFEYYLRPSENWWRRDIPLGRTSLIAALTLAASFLMHRPQLRKMAEVRNLALPWIVLMALNVAMVSTWAVDSELNYRWGTTLLNHFAIYGLIIGVVRSLEQFDAFGAMHMLGASYWGWNAIGERRFAGRLEGVGSSDTKASNPGASHLLTILPFIFNYIFVPSGDRRMRVAAIVALPLVANLFVLYNSRGAVVGLVVAACATVFIVRGRTRFKMLAAVLAALTVVLMLADPQFIARQRTTANAAEEDNSAQSRIETWKAALLFVEDHPFGTGGRGFHVLSPRYIPDIVADHGGDGRSAHNTFIQVTAEWGLQGLFFYLAMIFSTLQMLRRVRSRGTTASPWYYRALALEAALIGITASAMFGDRLYTESVYWMCGLGYAVYRAYETDAVAEQVVETARASSPIIIQTFPPRLPEVTIRERVQQGHRSA